jgi:hypothetical protein
MTQERLAYIGMAWYRPEDYATILRIMEDRERLFDTYEEWLMGAERGEKSMRLQGSVVVRVYIDPITFPQWCLDTGHNIDAKARMDYANLIAAQEARKAAH